MREYHTEGGDEVEDDDTYLCGRRAVEEEGVAIYEREDRYAIH